MGVRNIGFEGIRDDFFLRLLSQILGLYRGFMVILEKKIEAARLYRRLLRAFPGVGVSEFTGLEGGLMNRV